jgi:hypothetical protein
MGKMKQGYARKRDANEPGIARALELAGASVVLLDKPVDLLVGCNGIDHQIEVKNGRQPPSWQRITPDQSVHMTSWNGRDVIIVRNIQEALTAIGVPPSNAQLIGDELRGEFDEYGVPI